MRKGLFFGEKKAAIRKAGMRTEKKFFGKRGIFSRAGHTSHLKNSDVQTGFPSWPVLLEYVGSEGWKPLGRKGTVAFSRTVGSLFQILQKEARDWRVLYRTFLTAKSDDARSLGTYDALDKAMIAANRQASDWSRKTKKNPITLNGNPPVRVNTTVAGVLYNRCLEIRAEKTTKGLKGLYYHPFLERSQVCILALDNGDLLVHSKAGEKLWKLH